MLNAETLKCVGRTTRTVWVIDPKGGMAISSGHEAFTIINNENPAFAPRFNDLGVCMEPKMGPRINIVTLGVYDLAAARAFYEDGLGWRVSSASNEHIVFMQLGALVLALYPWKALAEDALQDSSAVGEGFRGMTLAHNVADKESVAPILALAEKAGGKIVKPAQDVFWGGHSGYFADLDGHLWEVAWNPFVSLSPTGELILP